jgi:hypothetical protein
MAVTNKLFAGRRWTECLVLPLTLPLLLHHLLTKMAVADKLLAGRRRITHAIASVLFSER